MFIKDQWQAPSPPQSSREGSVLSMLLSNTVLWRCLAFLGVLLLLWGGLSSEPIPQYTSNFDKYTHGLAFACLTAAFLLAFPRWWRSAVVLLMLSLGFGIELGQDMFLERRSFDWGDFAVDAVGIAIGLVVVMILRRWA